jgi:hypothetical protein
VVQGKVIASDCPHGIPMHHQELSAAVYGYIKRLDKRYLEFERKYRSSGTELDHNREGSQGMWDTLRQFWSEPKHARLIDDKLIHFCFAHATVRVQLGDMDLSRRLGLLGSYLATWFKMGKDTFLGALRGMPVAGSSNHHAMINFRASIKKMETDRNLVLFLSKQIPCSCLDENKKNAKQAPKKGRCCYCSSEGLKLELKKCSQCKSVQYCSKECQVADWRAGHKKECEIMKQEREQTSFIKAQPRR